MAKMYLGLATAPGSGLWGIVDDHRLVGYIAGCASVEKTYRWLAMRCGLGLLIAAGPALFRFSVLRKLSSVLLYPFRHHDGSTTSLPSRAELLAIAIEKSEYRKGHGKRLICAFEESLRQWGVREYQVLTNIDETDSNAFYRAAGFKPAGTIKHHTLTLQVYRKLTTP